jgi:hypothetical protein
MFIELNEVTTSGISAGQKRLITVNVDKISSFYPIERSDNCQINLRRGTLMVEQTYEQVKELVK